MNDRLADVLDRLKSVRMVLPIGQYLPEDDVLDDYEKKIGFKFSDDYRVFLKTASDSLYNGKMALRVTEHRNHPLELMQSLVEARRMGVPNDWLPICEDNGDYYCITPNGQVCFWDHNGQSDEIWSDLASWIEQVWLEGN